MWLDDYIDFDSLIAKWHISLLMDPSLLSVRVRKDSSELSVCL